MIRCEKCDQPCGTETHRGSDSHGFTYGPREEYAEERSDCCGAEVYDCCTHPENLHIGLFCPVIGCKCIATEIMRGLEDGYAERRSSSR